MSVASAMKAFCKECYGDSFFRQCKTYHCILNQFLNVARGDFPSISRLKAIRQYCLDCVGSSEEVKVCTCDGSSSCNGIENYKCPLYDYRFGRNPFTKRKGNPQTREVLRNSVK